jgi:glutathione S-transferase
MGISLRCYARHRGVTLAAVQKARQTGRIPILADGTVDATAADTAWDAAAAARRITEKVPADPTRVKLPAGTLAAAQETVRATLAQQGVGAGALVTLADARLAGELLRVQQRANAIAAQAVESRLRQRSMAGEAIDKRLVDALVANTVRVITEYVPPEDVSAALDKLRELQAHCLDRPPPVE